MPEGAKIQENLPEFPALEALISGLFDVFVYILNKGWVQKIERFDWEIPY